MFITLLVSLLLVIWVPLVLWSLATAKPLVILLVVVCVPFGLWSVAHDVSDDRKFRRELDRDLAMRQMGWWYVQYRGAWVRGGKEVKR